jgi:hypothetical protein
VSEETPDIDLDSVFEGLGEGALEGFEFIINADGSVTFIDFPPEMVEIAFALNPDDPLVCERKALLDASDDTPL